MGWDTGARVPPKKIKDVKKNILSISFFINSSA